jgi:hypothetical protein
MYYIITLELTKKLGQRVLEDNMKNFWALPFLVNADKNIGHFLHKSPHVFWADF